MLIKFDSIVEKYGKPNGIIHIGAHLLEERGHYLSHGIDNTIWIEANPQVFSKIDFINDGSFNERAFNYAISNVDDNICNFNITNNGESSSILELEKHKIHHPHIFVTDIITVTTKRMDTLLSENLIDLNNYNFINIDIQGAELLALKSFGKLIDNFKYIYTEINTNNLYKDCALVEEIDEYLKEYGFQRVETSMTDFEWGDALYLKK